MPTTPNTGPYRRRALVARWGRFVDTLLPTPDSDRLVRVAQVTRSTLPLAEGSLSDMSMSPVIQETRHLHGEPTFAVLVAARDAEVAREALSGL